MTKHNSIKASSGVYFTWCLSGEVVSLVDASFYARVCFLHADDIVGSVARLASANDVTKCPISRDVLPVTIAAALRRAYAGERHAAKRLASLLQIATRSARALLSGYRSPCAWILILLMAFNRDLRDDINALVDAIEAQMLATLRATGKTHLLPNPRRDNGQFRHRSITQADMGQGSDWHADSSWLWNHIVLVDVAQLFGRIGWLPKGSEPVEPHADGVE